MGWTTLPPISDAALPRAVRAGSDADKRAYKAALGFERVLVGELVRSLTASAPELSDGPRGDAVSDAMADALTQAGGLGLAQQLYVSTRRSQP